MHFREQKYFVKMKCLLKKTNLWDKKHFFPKNLKEATNNYF